MARFNLNSFFALDAILRAPTLTEAARINNLSQPAMSLALKQLRALFQDEIVNYGNGQAEFTSLAEQLRPRVAEILKSSQEVIGLSKGFDPKTDTRVMTIAAPEYISYFVLPQLRAMLAVEAPHMTLEEIIYLKAPRDLLKRADIAIVPEWAVDSRSSTQPLCVEEMGCLVPVGSELLTRRDTTTYLSCQHVGLQDEADQFYWKKGGCGEKLIRARNVVAEVTSIEALPYLVHNGQSVATTTMRFAQKVAALSVWVSAVGVPEIKEPVPFVIQTLAHRQEEPSLKWLIRQIVSIGANQFVR